MKNFKTLALALTVASITLPAAANAAYICVMRDNVFVNAKTNPITIQHGFSLLKDTGGVVVDQSYNKIQKYTDNSWKLEHRLANAVPNAKNYAGNASNTKGLKPCNFKTATGQVVKFSGYVYNAQTGKSIGNFHY